MAEVKDPVFDPKAHTIIPLAAILNSEPAALEQVKKEFTERGWCIIRKPAEGEKVTQKKDFFGPSPPSYSVLSLSEADISKITAFFAQSHEEKHKSAGYGAVPHKESIHLITPFYDDIRLPFAKMAAEWAKALDSLSLDLLEVLAKHAFECTVPTLATRADLPVAFQHHYGMLDIAHYVNTQTAALSPEIGYSTKEVNCVPHYDPGLLSLSFLSTHDGLQLQDPATNTWFAGPVNTRAGEEDLGVIWLGEAAVKASKGAFKSGIHRVVYPNTPTPRTTAWYEMCTVEQYNSEGKELSSGTVKPPNILKAKRLTLKSNGEKRQIERYYGVPNSKVPRRTDYYKAYYSEGHPGAKYAQ